MGAFSEVFADESPLPFRMHGQWESFPQVNLTHFSASSLTPGSPIYHSGILCILKVILGGIWVHKPLNKSHRAQQTVFHLRNGHQGSYYYFI